MRGVEHLHRHRVPEKSGDKSERQHERQRQRHRAVKNDNRDDVKVGIKHPVQRRDEDLDELGDANQHHKKDEKDHGVKFEIRVSP